jgi:hypothetical protein
MAEGLMNAKGEPQFTAYSAGSHPSGAVRPEPLRQRKFNLCARLAAEFVGSAFLVAAVVGSSIMGERLAGGNVARALLANRIATGAALVALIVTFGPISGAHLTRRSRLPTRLSTVSLGRMHSPTSLCNALGELLERSSRA